METTTTEIYEKYLKSLWTIFSGCWCQPSVYKRSPAQHFTHAIVIHRIFYYNIRFSAFALFITFYITPTRYLSISSVLYLFVRVFFFCTLVVEVVAHHREKYASIYMLLSHLSESTINICVLLLLLSPATWSNNMKKYHENIAKYSWNINIDRTLFFSQRLFLSPHYVHAFSILVVVVVVVAVVDDERCKAAGISKLLQVTKDSTYV